MCVHACTCMCVCVKCMGMATQIIAVPVWKSANPLSVGPCLSTLFQTGSLPQQGQAHCPVSFRRFFLYSVFVLPAGTSWDYRHLCSVSGSYVDSVAL